MKNLLVVDASPRFEHSVSRSLCDRLVQKWRQAFPNGSVTRRDLVGMDLPHIDLSWIGGAVTPADQHNAEQARGIRLSNELVAELQAADHIIFATPMHNFMISALMKLYVDQIVRPGVTVSKDYEGLVRGKTAVAIVTTGGDFSPGAPFEAANMASPYLRQTLGFIGIVDLEVILAVRTRLIDEGGIGLADYLDQHDAEIDRAIASLRSDSRVG